MLNTPFSVYVCVVCTAEFSCRDRLEQHCLADHARELYSTQGIQNTVLL